MLNIIGNIVGLTNLIPIIPTPTRQASGVTITNITSTSLSFSWINGNGGKRLVLMRAGEITSDPVNNISYTGNSIFGSGSQIGTGNYVVYTNTGNSLTVTSLSANTIYDIMVYEYNSNGISRSYLTTSSTLNPITELTFTTEYQAVLSRGTALSATLPSISNKKLDNAYLRYNIILGTWSVFDTWWQLNSRGSDTFARINWKTPTSFGLTDGVAPTWSSGGGFTFNGTTQFLRTGFIPSTHGINFTLNSAGMGVYVATNTSGAFTDMGCLDGSSGSYLQTRSAANALRGRINNTTPETVINNATTNTSIGLTTIERLSSTFQRFLRNAIVGVGGSGTTSNFRPTIEMFIGARNANGSADQFSNRQIGFAYIGSQLGNLHSDFYAGLTAYIAGNIKFFTSLSLFQIGNLQEIYPTKTYSELSAIRQSNWGVLKFLVNLRKADGQELVFPDGTIEIEPTQGETITISNGQTLRMAALNKDTTNIIIHPFAPRNVKDILFTTTFGGQLFVRDVTFSMTQRKLYETYQCVLKKNSNPKLIELLGDVRPAFWSELSIGKSVFYDWEFEIVGENNTVASWNVTAKTVTMTNNINALVSNNQVGPYVYFGSRFQFSVSVSDYLTYGKAWYLDEGIYFLTNIDATIGTDTILDFKNVVLDSFERNIVISSSSCKLKFRGDNTLKRTQISLNFFAGDIANGQTITLETGATLTLRENGYIIVGTAVGTPGIGGTSDNILGSGAYIHPNVQLRFDGRLELHDNAAAAFRQYSASGTHTVGVGYFSHIAYVNASNNGEYDVATSNSLPTTIDECYLDVLRVGGDTTVNKGRVTGIAANNQSQKDPGASIVVVFNDTTINGQHSWAWSSSIMVNSYITYNNPIFIINTATNLSDFIRSENDHLSGVTINNATYAYDSGSGVSPYVLGGTTPAIVTLATSLMRLVNLGNVIINGIDVGAFYCDLLVSSTALNTESQHSKKITFTGNVDIKSSSIHSLIGPGTMQSDKIISLNAGIRSELHRFMGYAFNMKIAPKLGNGGVKSIVNITYGYPKPTPSNILVSNALEIDFNHNAYTVNSGIIKHISPILYDIIVIGSTVQTKISSSNCFDGNILLTPSGGNLVFQSYDPITNPNSNIINTITVLSGQTALCVCDRKNVFFNGTTNTSTLLGTGNGSQTVFSNVLSDALSVPASLTITAGAITGTSDTNGVISGIGIAYGFVDYFSGMVTVRFSSPVSNTIPVNAAYSLYSNWKNTGGWTISAV